MPMPSSRATKTHGTLPERSRRARHGNVRHAQGLARTGVREPRGLVCALSRSPSGASRRRSQSTAKARVLRMNGIETEAAGLV